MLLRSEMSDLGQLWQQRLAKGGWAFQGATEQQC
jgi:hypothetical protein